ncbi:DEAD/DEAH box helicase [Marinobacterium aestuarii]|uniref:DEAD/DEAH box helicase n=1 Tax=Marinobacterium aestuarii TaxID=1821621 RepID=A0A1A9EZW5_9GAMM|nr:DEAD/DEAH box helicase [Marinobacterium aestuarii]ANG63069.1 DEAD/DEAH box helicase [Marinobacterium aestuarii]
MSGYFKDLINQSLNRTREATLSILGIQDQGLRTHLSEQMHNRMGEAGCFFAPPVFEHTFGWEAGDVTFAQLKGGLLSESVVAALTDAPNENYRFDAQIYPYKHQLTSWKALLAERPKSAVITTGTGSGKTECFMVPILQDLVSEYECSGRALVGVRALFLYPLNALINSQRERLDAWTSPFGDSIRFCLYNGNTENLKSKVKKEQGLRPNEILSRERLREEPAPILMTNATMLEYMLVRQVDEPIIRISREQRSLRWIVLDEAHTYIGSQAAELSLLLRRVVEAFGKEAHEIRFVATSATIAGEDAAQKLQSYLASLAGVKDDQVIVIGGSRTVPTVDHSPTNRLSFDEIRQIDSGRTVSGARYDALSNHRLAYFIRNRIVGSQKPLDLNELVADVESFLDSQDPESRQQELLGWIDLMTDTQPTEKEPPFLKLRGHFHQRMLHGLWSCIDAKCSAKSAHLKQWPFGNVYVSQRARCECNAPVYELAFCGDCKTPHLVAEDVGGCLKQASPYAGDEFSLQDEGADDEVPEVSTGVHRSKQPVVIAPSLGEGYLDLPFDTEKAELGALSSPTVITVRQAVDYESACVQCGERGKRPAGFLRKAYLGAPFYVSNAVPTVLEFCPDPSGEASPESLPGRGRKLITFTDSRQGTARMAVRMQQEAERSRLRGMVFQILRNRQAAENQNAPTLPEKSVEALLKDAEQLEQMGMTDLARQRREEARQKQQGSAGKTQAWLSWHELVSQLAAGNDIKHSILDYNKYANPEFFGGHDNSLALAGLLLLREYARRPKNQNSTETLALVQVGYQGLEKVETLPRFWSETLAPKRGGSNEREALTLHDWRDFLKVTLDFYVRENTFFVMNDNERAWLGAKFAPKELFAPGTDLSPSSRVKLWPQVAAKGVQPRLVKLLAQGCGLDPADATSRDKMNEWLKAAWQELIRLHILQSQSGGYTLERRALKFTLPQAAWVCPMTYRLLDTTFRGLTPYIPNKIDRTRLECQPVRLPDFTSLAPQGEPEGVLAAIRSRVAQSQDIQELRQVSLWSDISDRTVEGGFYYRTAEHSAQQSAKRLENYEQWFKQGKVNVLNCSTTMEMGVDIGGISAVVMNNVPPHPANYLQRAGRAGRRSEARSVAYTLCKSDPHNTRVFANPKWAFETAIPAPVITLSATPLVQRHVNSYLLSAFLKNQTSADGDQTRLTVQWFFNAADPVVDQFADWLGSESRQFADGVKRIVKRTALEMAGIEVLAATCAQAIRQLAEIWQEEYRQINQRLSAATDPSYKKALELEKSRHEAEYLLKDLAARAFLPGYGFPTNVVTLNTYNVEDFKNKKGSTDPASKDREDNIFTYKEQPSRGLDIAVREYAPGAQIVIDGRVYRAAGIKMQSYQEGDSGGVQKFDLSWQCTNCGASGYREYAYAHGDDLCCTHCESEIPASKVKRVLRPLGFVTDFYEATSNDVSSQKYIPVERPRVQVDGSLVALPDRRCGFVRFGEDGQTVVHSGGEHGTGFAVCMSCGRADSMLVNGDLPMGMRPDQGHRPVGGASGSRKQKDCSGERVMSNLYLGYQARTHVVEWTFRNPLTGGWIDDDETGRVIATTLAVALRDAVSDYLGIASSEMGFGVRPDRDLDTGETRSVVQVYDNVAGGAGFVMTALHEMTTVVASAIEKLKCAADCESVCSSCLASKDSRVEFEQLNRKAALQWLEEARFAEHFQLPEPFSAVEGAKYWPYEPQRFIRHWINKSATGLLVRVGGDLESWDLGNPDFRKQLIACKLIDGLDVSIVIDSQQLPTALKEELALLSRFGIRVAQSTTESVSHGLVSPIQMTLRDGGYVTLLTDNRDALTPGGDWLMTEDASVWISTEQLPSWPLEMVDTAGWLAAYDSATVIEVIKELNGDVRTLANRFKQLLSEKAPGFLARLEGEPIVSIRYEDRYLRSPWTVMLLAGFMQVLKSDQLKTVRVDTVAGSGTSGTADLWNDWPQPDDMEDALKHWLSAVLGTVPDVYIHNSVREVSHRRVLTLELQSGSLLKLAFDQGMGYWICTSLAYGLKRFNFADDSLGQANQMLERWKGVKMLNGGDWPTDIALYEVS